MILVLVIGMLRWLLADLLKGVPLPRQKRRIGGVLVIDKPLQAFRHWWGEWWREQQHMPAVRCSPRSAAIALAWRVTTARSRIEVFLNQCLIKRACRFLIDAYVVSKDHWYNMQASSAVVSTRYAIVPLRLVADAHSRSAKDSRTRSEETEEGQ